MTDQPIRVFLLDDHEVVRQGLRFLLENSGGIDVVGEAALASEGIARIPALRPDVAILDARLPDGSGIDVCRDVRSTDPSIKALVLTSYDDDGALFAAIGVGSLLMLTVYNKVVSAANKNPEHDFNIHGERWVRTFLIPITVILLGVTTWRLWVDGHAADSAWTSVILTSLGLILNALFFSMMLIISFLPQTRRLLGDSKSTTG